MIIDFTIKELEVIVAHGTARRMNHIFNGTRGRYGASSNPPNAWQMDIEGVLAEAAVAKHLKIPWRPAPMHAVDVGDRHQVRSTQRDNGHLFVHPEDSDNHIFWLAITMGHRVRLAGFLIGSSCKQDMFWNRKIPRPAFLVTQNQLRPATDDHATIYPVQRSDETKDAREVDAREKTGTLD